MRRLCLFLLFASLSVAQADKPERTHAITIDDYFTMATPMEVAVAEKTGIIAYTEARWQKSTNDRKADLWVVHPDGKRRRLTADRVGARSIRLSSDSKSVTYIGIHRRAAEKEPPYDGKPQVWRVRVKGGEPEALTRAPKGVALYQIDDRRGLLYYVVNVPAQPEGPFAKLKEETKEIEYGDGGHERSQLWRVNLQSWRKEKLLDDGRTIREISLAPDGGALGMITTPDDTVISFEGESRVEVFDPARKKSTVVWDKADRAGAPSKFGWLEHLSFGPGGKVAFEVIYDGYPAEVVIAHYYDPNDRMPNMLQLSPFNVERPAGVQVKGYGSPLAWRGERICYLGEDSSGSVRVYEAAAEKSAASEPSPLTAGAGRLVVGTFAVAGKWGALVAATPEAFSEIYRYEHNALKGDAPKVGKLQRITSLNPQTETWKLPKVSSVTWKGANGDEVHGVLELPADAKPGVPLPLIVAIHGGPTTSVPTSMDFNPYEGRCFLSAKGYAILCPNYRGSTGNGDKFLTDLVGKENDIEVEDILKGVDHLIAQKIADPNRLGVMGWSNGGYLTNCLIAKTTRFKAASSGAGIVDTVMEWGSNDEPAYMNALKGGLPWDKPDAYRRTSPLYQFDKIKTPTLIHVGGNDVRCPPAHSRTLYRALKLYNKVPTELVTYKGEPHGLTKYANRRAKMMWDVAWFERYIK